MSDMLVGPVTPILITIGPQCAGKTAFLRSISSKIVDVAMDDDTEAYERVPTLIASADLMACRGDAPDIHTYRDTTADSTIQSELDPPEFTSSYSDVLSRRVFSQTLRTRLRALADAEQGLLTLVFSGAISFDDEVRWRLKAAIPDENLYEMLVSCVDELIVENARLTSETIDIFVVDARDGTIFRANNRFRETAFSRKDTVLSWGNTNTSPHTYQSCLLAADMTKRPVRFIRWGYELPRVSLHDLIRRNLRRFLATGRYIPVATIRDYLAKAESLIARAPTHKQLAGLARYHMDAAGFVYSFESKQRAAYPYLPTADVLHSLLGQWTPWFTSPVVRRLAIPAAAVPVVGVPSTDIHSSVSADVASSSSASSPSSSSLSSPSVVVAAVSAAVSAVLAELDEAAAVVANTDELVPVVADEELLRRREKDSGAT